jgi:hypothetical protein
MKPWKLKAVKKKEEEKKETDKISFKVLLEIKDSQVQQPKVILKNGSEPPSTWLVLDSLEKTKVFLLQAHLKEKYPEENCLLEEE